MKKLLFIGGWTRNKNSYKMLHETIPDDYDVLFLSCGEIVDQKKINHADYIKNFLEKNNVTKCIMAGHSLGGGLAIEFAEKYPEMLDELILIDSSGIKSQQKFHEKLKGAARNQMIHFKHKAKENVTTLARLLARPVTNYRSMKFAYVNDIKDKMKNISCDTLILWGEKDHMFPPSQAGEIHKLIPNSRLLILPEMDHDWIIHSPELFWDNIAQGESSFARSSGRTL